MAYRHVSILNLETCPYDPIFLLLRISYKWFLIDGSNIKIVSLVFYVFIIQNSKIIFIFSNIVISKNWQEYIKLGFKSMIKNIT